MTSSARWFRSIEAAAGAGLGFAILSVVGLTLLTSSPDPSAPDAELVSWYGDPAHRSSITVGLSLSIMAAISFLWFVAVIRRRVGEREDRFFATVFLGSGILLTAVMLAGVAVLASPALTIDLGDGRILDAAVLSGLNGLATTLLLVVLLRVQAVFVASSSTLALRPTAFSRWLSYLGYGVALVILVMPVVSEPTGLAFPIWVGILSIALLIRKTDIIANRLSQDEHGGERPD